MTNPTTDSTTNGTAAMTKQVRLGIIGLGAQGAMYAKFIADGMRART